MEATLQTLLDGGETIIADGAMGTMLFSLGLERGAAPVTLNIDRPELVASVHRAYIEAGAQIILTNTFVANRHNLSRNSLSDRVKELNAAAVSLAREEARHATSPVVVAGDIGPTGGIVASYGDVPYETAVDIFREQAAALAGAGVKLFWIETIENIEEMTAALDGARQAAPDIPVVATMSFGTPQNLQRTTYGATHQQAADLFAEQGVIAFGANCGLGLDAVSHAIQAMRVHSPEAPLVAKANAGIPILKGDEAVYPATPDMMADFASAVRQSGARIVGACCGSSPDHIRAISAALSGT